MKLGYCNKCFNDLSAGQSEMGTTYALRCMDPNCEGKVEIKTPDEFINESFKELKRVSELAREYHAARAALARKIFRVLRREDAPSLSLSALKEVFYKLAGEIKLTGKF